MASRPCPSSSGKAKNVTVKPTPAEGDDPGDPQPQCGVQGRSRGVRPRGSISPDETRAGSVEEAARVLGMPANTVKTHLRRARAALRGAWILEEGEP